jgi:fatty acid desaturase
MFPIPFHGFRALHLLHHKHTNDHNLDPDAFVGEGPSIFLPIHWVLMEARYYYLGIPMAVNKWRLQVS